MDAVPSGTADKALVDFGGKLLVQVREPSIIPRVCSFTQAFTCSTVFWVSKSAS